MKPTLNEEIGISQQGIDYVNSFEVKEPKFSTLDYETLINASKNNLPDMIKEIEKQRIRKQARNAWICVFVIIAITVILNCKS